jgi:CRP-like cAMP-binding protein
VTISGGPTAQGRPPPARATAPPSGLSSGLLMPAVRNELLAALPAAELEHLRPHLRRVKLVMDQVLHEVGESIRDVYFVEEGIVSLTADTMDSGLVEVGMTGREGVVGTPVLLSPDAIAVHRAIVQMPGAALRVDTASFRDAVEHCPVLRDCCLRYVQVIMAEASQSAACNARHELLPRLARWILTSHDRVDGDDLALTQEYMAQMLGVRRAGVSAATHVLQDKGLIRQFRGRIKLLDRVGLTAEACNCYQLIEVSRRKIMAKQD